MTTVGELVVDGHLIMSDGYRTKRGELAESGFRIIRVADVHDGSVFFDGPDFVSAEYSQAIGAKVGVPGDVLLTTKGTVGRVAKVPQLDELVVYSPQICFFRVGKGAPLLADYLRYWLGSVAFTEQARNVMNNTDMAPYINLADIRSLRIDPPDMERQCKVVEVLGALDDKIAANGRKVNLIELLLESQYAMTIKGGAKLLNLDSVAAFHNKRRVPLSAKERDERVGNVPYHGASGVFGYVDEPLFNEPLVLVGEDGSVVTGTGSPVVQYLWGPAWVNNHAHVLTGKGISTELLSVLLKQADVRHLVTGAVQPKISMGKLKTLDLVIPEDAARQELEFSCTSHMALLRATVEESRTLTALRDTLLPELMSGRLRVKDAEKQVEDVL